MRTLLLPLLLLLPSCSSAAPGDASPEAAESRQQELESALSAEGIYPEARPSRVTFYDHRSGVRIGLINESNVDKATYYSENRADLTYKVIPDLDMGALMKQLDEFGFFEEASLSSSRIPGARTTVQADRGGSVHTLAYATGDDATRHELVQSCATAVQAMYNAHQAFQIVENPEGARYFEEAQKKLQQSRN